MNNKLITSILALFIIFSIVLVLIIKGSDSFKPLDFQYFNYSNLNESFQNEIENSLKQNKPFFLVVINQLGCPTSLDNEVYLLNEYKDLEDLFVVFIGDDADYLKTKGLNLPYIHFNSIDDLFSSGVPPSNPFSLVMDYNFVYNFWVTDNNKPHNMNLRKSVYEFKSTFKSLN